MQKDHGTKSTRSLDRLIPSCTGKGLSGSRRISGWGRGKTPFCRTCLLSTLIDMLMTIGNCRTDKHQSFEDKVAAVNKLLGKE